MKKNSYTAGPWTVEQDLVQNGDIDVQAAGMLSVAFINVKDVPEDREGIPCETALANARLIANAPNLLEALFRLANEANGFLGMADVQRHGQTNSRVLRLRIEEAHDVIAKARGQ